MSLRQLSQNPWSNESVPFSPGAQSHWFKINSHPRIDKEFSPLANKTVRVCVWPDVLLWVFSAVGVVVPPNSGCFGFIVVYDLGLRFFLCRFCFYCCFCALFCPVLLLFLCYVFRLGVSVVLWLVTCTYSVLFGLGFVLNVVFIIPVLAFGFFSSIDVFLSIL